MMAYTATKTSAMQTAVKAAVDIAVAELGAGLLTDHDEVMSRIGEVQDEFQGLLFAQVDEDNAAIAANGGSTRSGGGNNRGGGGRGSSFSVQEARDTVLNFGAFKGLTLEQVTQMTDEEASNYSGGNYTKAGIDWLRWAAANKDPKASFIQKRAQVVLDNLP